MMPEDLTVEILNGEKEEIVEKVSSFWLGTGQSWNTLEHVLTQCREVASADLAHMMEHYNRKGILLYSTFSVFIAIDGYYPVLYADAPLTTEHMYKVVRTIRHWKQFCRYLCVHDKEDKRKTIAFFIEEPFFEASWKKVALALYYSFEDDTIDALFFYMKSPAG